jgi:hypothetical protein
MTLTKNPGMTGSPIKGAERRTSMRRTVSLIVAVCVILVSGCASIVSKSDWPVRVSSNPDGALCTVTDKTGTVISKGVTPTILTLKSGDGYFKSASYKLMFEKEGYQPVSKELPTSLNGWYWGNIVLGGLIGMLIVDPATGAMWSLDESVTGTLAALPGVSSPASGSDGPAAATTKPATPPAEAQSSLEQSPGSLNDTGGSKDATPTQSMGTQ